MGKIIRVTSSTSRPASATQYTAGDEISNSATAGSVVRMVFPLAGFRRGHVQRAGMAITPASGSVVITALDLVLHLFKTSTVPAAVGDNVTHPITGAQRLVAQGKFTFANGAWTNPLGALTAGTSAFQEVAPTLVTVQGNAFEFKQGETESLTAVLQVTAAWNPGAVVNAIAVELDINVE
jgi:hypothetical protein